MEAQIENIKFNNNLLNSTEYHTLYDSLINQNDDTYSYNTFHADLNSILSLILINFTEISSFQKEVLNKLFKELEVIRETIDPNRLSPFDYFFNSNDEELILYRNTEKSLINLIIHSEDNFALSIIGKKDKKDDLLEFYHLESDIESIAYRFLSK